jgi:GntR family transcriptional regulator
VIPFRVSFESGISLYEQVVYAAKKAVVSSQIRPGDPFPSVRELSKTFKINPNTAHKVVTQLVAEGILEVHSGIGQWWRSARPRAPRNVATSSKRNLSNS